MTTDAASEGLRARKQRETGQRIVEAALRLFLERGYEATTLDAIAAAADISRRTFFHYFDSKDSIVEALETGAEEAFRSSLASAPDGAPPLAAVEFALAADIARYGSEEALAIDRLLRSTEALRARKQANYERRERALFVALQERWSADYSPETLRVVAMAGIGALRIAAELWSAEAGRRPLQTYLSEVFQALRKAI